MTDAVDARTRGRGQDAAVHQWPLPRGRALCVTSPPAVMGIVNVTPDSFSDGGVHRDVERAVHAALAMEQLGAAVIDVGGESTRPGSDGVSLDEELSRVIPVIEGIRSRSEIVISIDTMKADVARSALAAGADMINDVTGLRDDAMLAVAAVADVPIVIMHMRGEPRTMQQLATYGDVVEDVAAELELAVDRAVRGGVARERILVDPGIGFAKDFDQNLELLANCERFTRIAPLLIGASRKGFIGHLTGRPAGSARAAGSLAPVASALRGGAAFVRVHDVQQTIDFLRVASAIAAKERR